MPTLAKERGWPVRHDHCFQRILLDAAFQGCWYDHVRARPAYVHADTAALSRAVAIARAVIDSSVSLPMLNRQSLDWRKSLRRRPR